MTKEYTLASSVERLGWLQRFVNPPIPILLASQEEVIVYYGVEYLRGNRGQRSLNVTVHGDVLGTTCADGQAKNSVACSINRKRCHIARRWDKWMAKLEQRTYEQVANEMTPESHQRSVPTTRVA
jgi:hypothetical protein